MKHLTILGASGSIGSSAVAFLRLHRDKFWLKNIAVKSDWAAAMALCEEFDCASVSIQDERAADTFAGYLKGRRVTLMRGPEGAAQLAADRVDVVLAAISGSQGLPSVLAAIRAGNQIALANKEALVCGGPSLLDLAKKMDVDIIPVDSEHSAIYQSMLAGKKDEVSTLLLTASGGPFRSKTIEAMRHATLDQALAHPNWRMGVKNSVDSATLANKGLELIEASYLFACNEQDIDVVINPSSILHSAVCYRDGSMIAQLGVPDMRMAVGYGLSWPERFNTGVKKLSLPILKSLQFEEVDLEKFHCLTLARQALRVGADGPLVYNAANEVAVSAFGAGRIGLLDIPNLIESCLEKGAGNFQGSIDDLCSANDAARDFCSRMLAQTFD